MENKKGYIYAIAHPITKQVVYIGQALNIKKRRNGHMANCQNVNLGKWLKGLKKQYLIPLFIELAQCDVAELLTKEAEFIAEYKSKGVILFNADPGTKYRVGRPNENKSTEDTAKGYQVSLTPNENTKIVSLYGSRTAALKLLLAPPVIKLLKSFLK